MTNFISHASPFVLSFIITMMTMTMMMMIIIIWHTQVPYNFAFDLLIQSSRTGHLCRWLLGADLAPGNAEEQDLIEPNIASSETGTDWINNFLNLLLNWSFSLLIVYNCLPITCIWKLLETYNAIYIFLFYVMFE